MPGSFSYRMPATANNRKGKVNRSNLRHIYTLVVSTHYARTGTASRKGTLATRTATGNTASSPLLELTGGSSNESSDVYSKEHGARALGNGSGNEDAARRRHRWHRLIRFTGYKPS